MAGGKDERAAGFDERVLDAIASVLDTAASMVRSAKERIEGTSLGLGGAVAKPAAGLARSADDQEHELADDVPGVESTEFERLFLGLR